MTDEHGFVDSKAVDEAIERWVDEIADALSAACPGGVGIVIIGQGSQRGPGTMKCGVCVRACGDDPADMADRLAWFRAAFRAYGDKAVSMAVEQAESLNTPPNELSARLVSQIIQDMSIPYEIMLHERTKRLGNGGSDAGVGD